MILTHDEYTTMGGTLSKDEFVRYGIRAETMLVKMTHGRCKRDAQARLTVKCAAFDLIQAMRGDDANGGREVASVSNDGVSVSYAATGHVENRYSDIVRSYLANETTDDGVPFLYAGVDA